MKLSYRGISYEANSATAPAQPTVAASDLKYRGASYRLGEVAKAESQNAILMYRGMAYTHQAADQNLEAVSVARKAVDLKYRGASYRLGEVAKAESQNAILTYRDMPETHQSAAPAVSATSVQDKVRVLTMNRHRAIQHRQQALFNRSAAEIGLSTQAATAWNSVAFS